MDENQQIEQSGVDMDDFDAGFNDGIEADASAESPEQSLPEPLDEFEQAAEAESGQTVPEQVSPEQVSPVQVSPVQVAPAAPAAPVAMQAMPQAPPVEISAEIADEYAELAKLSPKAAELAREDSPEGAAIRDRLGRVGADSAFDRAEVLLDRRERAAHAANAQQQAIEAHNQNFQHVLRAEHPELFAPTRTPEQNQRLMADVKTWIEGKPYAEARGLMDVYEGGRDPRQVAALLTRFKQEGGEASTGAGEKPTVDHTAALAVAGRGAPIVPKTVGGKDDFYAGFGIDE